MRIHHLPLLVAALLQQTATINVVTAQPLLQFATGEPDVQCRRFFAVDNDNTIVDEAGTFCLFLDPVAFPDQVTVSYATTNNWVMPSTATWFGTTVDDLPTNRDGEPQLRDFDFETDNGNNIDDALTTTTFIVPLQDIQGINDEGGGTIDFASGGCSQDGQSVTLFGVAASELLREDADGDEEEATGWADGLVPDDPDIDLWALFNFTLECVEPAQDTFAPTFSPFVPDTFFPTFSPMVPDTGFPTFSPGTLAPTDAPVLPPTNPDLLADGAMCDNGLECQSGACSIVGFCLASLGATCIDSSDCGSSACIQGSCGVCPVGDDDGVLTEELVERSYVAGLLSNRLTEGFSTTPVTLEFGNFYNRGTADASMVAKVAGVCYGIFAPTEGRPLTSFGTTPLNAFQQTCDVHERAYNAYFANERQLFELRLAQCASTCVNQQLESAYGFTDTPILSIALDVNACPVVLAGHGLGGATAVVASMVLLDLSPQVITLGAPRTVAANCPLMRRLASTQNYRMVNLGFVESYNTFLFDNVPQLSGGGLVHYGTPILLAVSDTLVQELNDDTTRAHVYSANRTSDVNDPSALSLYNSRLGVLNAGPCFPIPTTDAWENGNWCDADDICLSDRCRVFLDVGATSSVGLCAQKLETGSACAEDGDCSSDSCIGGLCAVSDGNGNPDGGPVDTPAPTDPPIDNGPPDNGGGGGGGGLNPCSLCSLGTECASGVCVTFEIPGGSSSVCAETSGGTMSNGCFCFPDDDEQCTNGRCETDASGSLSLCIAPLGNCETCDEPSDCGSGQCVDNLCALFSGNLPDACGGGGGDNGGGGGGGDNGGGVPVCTAPTCQVDEDCASGFCRIAAVSTCAETAEGAMADGCVCNPVDTSSCLSSNCVRDNPMLLDVGTCFPGAVVPVAVPLFVAQPEVLITNACLTDAQCPSGSSCSLKCNDVDSCGCDCPSWRCD